MDWLGKLLGLPQQFLYRNSEGSLGPGGGVIQGTASEAALVCMLAARARIMQGRPNADMANLVAYTSDQVL
jgi:glutamate/tyrosine decarboxylase-like PLP-dependent enzyme